MKPQGRFKPLFTISLANRTLYLTREGGGFIFLIFGIGFGAINTGNNLLYLILAMCCSFIAVSGVLSELALKNISLSGSTHKTIYCDNSYPLTFRIHNRKRVFPSYSLHVDLPPDQQDLYIIDHDPALYFFQIPAMKFIEKTVMFKPTKRGRLKIKHCQLSTSFPFGFFVKSKTVSLDIEATVFPAIREVKLPVASGPSQEGVGIVQQRGEELYALREFKPGDEANAVHWKSTAKTGKWRVKEFTKGGQQNFTLYLNIRDPQTGLLVPPDILEKRVVQAASLVYHLIQRGDEVSLATEEYQSRSGNSRAHLESLMTYLAFVGLDDENAPTTIIERTHQPA